MMEAVQINLHHAKAATAVLARTMAKENIEIAMVQEPWIGPTGNILGLNQVGKVLACSQSSRPRACLVFNRNTNFFPLTEFITSDVCAAEVLINSKKRIIASAYFPGDDVNCPPIDVQKLVQFAQDQGKDLLIGCDANAHHITWGSTDTNERGESLLDYVLVQGLNICNEGSKPTFINTNRREVLDVTFTNSNSLNWVSDWHVSEEPSCSDHRHIRFRLGIGNRNLIEYRSKKATNWEKYSNSLKGAQLNKIYRVDTAWKLEQSTEKLTSSLTAAFENSCPLKRRNLKADTTWWSDKLGKLRKRVRKLFNRASKSGEWETYSKELAVYKKEIRVAKQKSFKGFCEDVTDMSSCCRLQRALGSAKNKPIGTLIGENGMTRSDVETAKVLIQTHFPGAKLVNNQQPTPRIDSTILAGREDWRLAKEICKIEAVKWAISTFKPYKAGGDDGIFPALLQKGANEIAPALTKIYTASVALGHLPQLWRKVNVLHLHKPGKNETDPKAFRPISLMSFMLKEH